MKSFGLLLLAFLLSTPIRSQELGFEVYGVRDGLAQSQVYCLLQDSRGYLWIGTQGGGLGRYDGREFNTYTTRNGLSGNYVQALAEDQLGRLWIGSEKGLDCFDGRIVEKIDQGSFYGPVNALCIDKNGLLWIGGEYGLSILNPIDRKPVNLSNADQPSGITCLEAQPNGTVILGSTEGFTKAYVREGRVVFEPLLQGIGMAVSIASRENEVLFSTYGNGTYRMDSEGNSLLVEELSDFIVLCAESDQAGGWWFGSLKSGIIHLHRDGTVQLIDDRSGLPNNQVRALLVDDWANLWAGTSGGGLARYFGQRNLYLSKDSGLPGRQVYSITADSTGRIWLGVADKGIVRYDRRSASLERDSILNSGKVKALFTDASGRIWAGTDGQGVFVYDSDSCHRLGAAQGLSGNWIKSILQDQSGQIWVATSGGGITRISNIESELQTPTWRIFNALNGLPDDRVNTLCVDSLNRVWYGTERQGLGVILTDGSLIHFPPDSLGYGRNVRSLSIDPTGWLWAGTGDAGIARIDLRADKLEVNVLESALQPGLGNIYLIQADGRNQVWVGAGDGLYQYRLNDNGQVETPVKYSERDGFQGVETCANASYYTDDRELWVGTVDGVNCLFPEANSRADHPPKIRLGQVSLFYKPLQEVGLGHFIGDWGIPRDTLVLTYEQNHLSFELLGIHLGDPGNIRYQWWLEGADSSWTPLLQMQSATFSNLKPGDYTFHYRSCTAEGLCSEEGMARIKVLRPFWQKTWFQLGISGAFLLVIGSLIWWRIAAFKNREKEKNQRLKLQNKVLELEQQALRMQMNPHFIFNTLNSIQGLIALQDTKEARKQLSAFSRLMRTILENSREELIPLEDEINACKTYAELERAARGIEFDLEIRNELDPDTLVPPLILQPFIENAIVHGLSGLERKGLIQISANKENGSLKIEIRDNGRGRRANEQSSHRSLGVQVTRERLEKLGEHFSSIQYEDLRDGAGNALGTLVILRMKLLQG